MSSCDLFCEDVVIIATAFSVWKHFQDLSLLILANFLKGFFFFFWKIENLSGSKAYLCTSAVEWEDCACGCPQEP